MTDHHALRPRSRHRAPRTRRSPRSTTHVVYTAIVEAQHLPAADHGRHLLLENLYAVELVRDGHRWVIRRVHIDNVRYTGDPQILVGR